MNKEESLVLSANEAASALKVHVNTIYALVRERKLPVLRLNRKVLIPRAGLEALIAGAAKPGANNG